MGALIIAACLVLLYSAVYLASYGVLNLLRVTGAHFSTEWKKLSANDKKDFSFGGIVVLITIICALIIFF